MPSNSIASKRSPSNRKGLVSLSSLSVVISFLLGCILSTTIVLNAKFASLDAQELQQPLVSIHKNKETSISTSKQQPEQSSAVAESTTSSNSGVLSGIRILVAIAAYDFAQIPHLEEVLDGYYDICASGAPSRVDVVIHTTVPYPVTLIDLFNSRFQQDSTSCEFTVTIIVKPPFVKLHLVDFHRTLFYDKLDDYDLFIYSEDDIRVTPKTVAAYLYETERVKQLLVDGSSNLKPSDFNVGIVRYEYNFPPDIIINDKTRHATQNVKRVYWEHAWKPPIPKSVDAVPQAPLSQHYVHMQNHHQGMYLATRDLLQAWKDRDGCHFDQVRDRPGMKNRPSQPSEGTQRVWMSSTMLYGGRHCNVQQVIPMDTLGQLTVLHLPNKNYRRVGKKGRLGGNKANATKNEFSNGSEQFELPSDMLLTAMELHVEIRKRWPAKPQQPMYRGIQMVDEVGRRGRTPLLDRRMAEYHDYVARGGVMSDEDMTKTSLF